MHNSEQPQARARKHPVLHEDTSTPIIAEAQEMQDDARVQNRAIMECSEMMGRRVRIRFQPEIWVKWRGKWGYRRARQCGVILSCPDPDQAELGSNVILKFAESLNGKWLTVAPGLEPSTTSGPKTRLIGSGFRQGIS